MISCHAFILSTRAIRSEFVLRNGLQICITPDLCRAAGADLYIDACGRLEAHDAVRVGRWLDAVAIIDGVHVDTSLLLDVMDRWPQVTWRRAQPIAMPHAVLAGYAPCPAPRMERVVAILLPLVDAAQEVA